MRVLSDWRLRTRSLELGRRTLVMGVVNITPDSFSDGGSFLALDDAVRHGQKMIEEGADILDLGAESTRPGTRAGAEDPAVSAAEEQARLLPVLEAIRKRLPDAVISVDTYKAETARAALAVGADVINDVSGFAWDPAVSGVCAEFGAGVILGHTRGMPDEWKGQPQLAPDELMTKVSDGLANSLRAADEAGVARESVILDPGYGFGKRFGENFVLLARQGDLLKLGRPIAVGLSRKSFLGNALVGRRGLPEGSRKSAGAEPTPVRAREHASLAAMTAAILNGASVVRVHEVRAAVEAAQIADEIVAASKISVE